MYKFGVDVVGSGGSDGGGVFTCVKGTVTAISQAPYFAVKALVLFSM